ERYFRRQRLEAIPNERQTFADLVLPALDGAMSMVNLALRRFEITVYGSTTRQNFGRNPFTERHAPGHQADAVVEITEDLQLVIVESAKLTGASEEKIAQDHFKLARDMKDTWIEVARELVSDNKRPPSDLTVFRVQAFGTELVFLAIDFKGCFRLYDLATIRIPNSFLTIKKNARRFLSTCVGFAKLVACRHHEFGTLQDLSTINRRSSNRAIANVKVASTTPTKPANPGKRKL
ncbi:hypothetical protein BGZ47_004308, partial [Haplosporangium gracile]